MNRDEIDTAERIRKLRKEYQGSFDLDEASAKGDPHEQFADWFDFAVKAQLVEPNAMALATVGDQSHPALRMVLLKEFSASGFLFYTNYQSRKGRELENNPRVALLFYWPQLERQVRIEGIVEKLSEEENRRYFSSRPRGSQLGAAASPQSQVITDRAVIEEKHRLLDEQFSATEIPCPSDWGGYRVIADYFEFWQGRENRLHDRVSYRKAENRWTIERLAP